MPYRVRGSIDATCRMLLLKEADMSFESSDVFNAGEWELICDSQELRMVIARETASGEAYGFGGITPEFYDSDVLLAINNLGDFLAIDDTGNGLVVSST